MSLQLRSVLTLIMSFTVISGVAVAQTPTTPGGSRSTANVHQAVTAGSNQGVVAGSNAGVTQGLTVNGAKAPDTPIQPVVAPAASAPFPVQLVPTQVGYPVRIIGSVVDFVYLTQCNPRRVGKDLDSDPQPSASGKAVVIFSGHQNQNTMVRKGDTAPDVDVDFSGEVTMRCLGKVTIEVSPDSLKKGLAMDITALTLDAMNSVAARLKGAQEGLVLLSHPAYWGGSMGTTATGVGDSGGLGVNIPGVVSIGVGKTNTTADTTTIAKIGIPFIFGFRAKASDPEAVTIKIPNPPKREE